MHELRPGVETVAGCNSVNEAVWVSLYSTTSRPFDPPETGKIAIKVINHYGDEVLEVCTVAI